MTCRSNKPTFEEVSEYIFEKQFTVDPSAFFDHYEMVGWVYGKARHPIKDWKAAVRTWERNNAKYRTATSNQSVPRHKQQLEDQDVLEILGFKL